MRFKSRYNPAGGITDFVEYFRQPTPYRWPILAASCLMTFTLLFWVTQEETFVPPERPKVVLISTFAEGRTDAEIRATNIENQRIKELRQAEREAAFGRKVDAYKALGRATGLDVDAIEAQAEIERTREQAAEAAKREQLYTADGAVADKPE